MKFIYTYILLASLLCLPHHVEAQNDYDFYLNKAKEYVAANNCEKTKDFYTAYKELSNKIDLQVEIYIYGCSNYVYYPNENVDKQLYQEAIKGSDVALNNVGVYYYEGKEYFPKDKDKAESFFIAAASTGSAKYQKQLAYYYENGFFGVKHFLNARKWYEKAASQGCSESKKRLDWLNAPEREAIVLAI